MKKLFVFLVAVLVFGFAVLAQAQKKKADDTSLPPLLDEQPSKRGKKLTQTLPPPAIMPAAVVAETAKLSFQTSALIPKGLLSQQTREALRTLLRTNHNATIVKLRAFVAGSGDMRRVPELVAEIWAEKKLPLPAVSVVQTGALPLEGAQIVLESTSVEKRVVNPHGLAFVSGQTAPTLEASLEKVLKALQGVGIEASGALSVTCFLSTLGKVPEHSEVFPGAAFTLVQMQREPVGAQAVCEAVGRLAHSPEKALDFSNPSAERSEVAQVNSPELVLTATQLVFGSEESDLKLALERLQHKLLPFHTRLGEGALWRIYLARPGLLEKVRQAQKAYVGAVPPASTTLPFEGLPSLDATAGFELICAGEAKLPGSSP